ncbi:nitrous-oxide reductase [Candidatus Hakubella thermalkaliphila]|uniref:Cytochrome aa3 subunit 2 n=1 Tax=Candidatus Hakubella thermalkaliphila TaxID=2754717 RepID=A0A6V8NVD7_9ACTN|nr:nitrous-oxide reductase [Candidatus Hakubella thermalkaliphila]
MSRKEIIAVILFILATVITIAGVVGVEAYRRRELYTVELTSRAPEHVNWYPQEITVPLGEEVRILIRNIDTVSHGFALPDFEVAVPEIKAGQVAVVQFVANKSGTFPFLCTVWCAGRHMEMRGELIVE